MNCEECGTIINPAIQFCPLCRKEGTKENHVNTKKMKYVFLVALIAFFCGFFAFTKINYLNSKNVLDSNEIVKEEIGIVPEIPQEPTPIIPETPSEPETPQQPTPDVPGTPPRPETPQQPTPVVPETQPEPEITNPQNNRSVIHFISTGSSDAFLIESNGTYGLVDASNPYNDGTLQSVAIKQQSVATVIEYLDSLGIKYLDYIVATHSHSDHIGGMPEIAKKYVNNKTKYYYRKYDGASDNEPSWDNEGYYNRAIEAVKENGATLIDVTNQNITLKYSEFELTLLNTDKGNEIEENYNAIGILVKCGKVKVFLASDIEAKDSEKIMNQIGKVDVLKLNHHGYSGASYKYVSTLQPDYVVISNSEVHLFANPTIAYLKEKYNTKSYYTGAITGAIKLHINEEKYYFENVGDPISLNMTGWVDWLGNWVYLENGKLYKGWLLYKNEWYYLDNDGIMLKGWQYLSWPGGNNWFYFDLENGNMYENECVTIDNKKYCFDSNGTCYKGR